MTGWWLFLLVPLFAASLSRPLGWWDYLTFAPTLRYQYPVTFRNIIPGYLQAFRNTYVIRPTASLWYDLNYLLFGGEFWMWYVVKWAAKFASVYLVTRLLDRLGVSKTVQAVIAAYLLFHTADFQLMLTALDGWAALGILGILVLLFRGGPAFHDLSRLTKTEYAGFLVLFLFTLGIKEVSFAVLGVLVFVMAAAGRSVPWRLWPAAALLGFWVWLLKSASNRVSDFSLERYLFHVRKHLSLCVPPSTLGMLSLIVVLLLFWAMVAAYRSRRRDVQWLTAFCLAGCAVTILFNSPVSQPGTRYVIPAVFLSAIPLGIALEALPARKWWASAFVVLYPLSTAGDLYQQELAYQQGFYEFSEVLQVMQTRAEQGFPLALTGDGDDIGMEVQETIKRFFGEEGRRLYGIRERKIRQGSTEGWPEGVFVLLTASPPDRISGKFKGLDVDRITRVEHATRGGYGVLERLASFYGTVAAVTGNGHGPTYDMGAPMLSNDPWFYLYTVEAADPGEAATVIHTEAYTRKKTADVVLSPEQETRFETKDGEVFKATIPLGTAFGPAAPRYGGTVQVTKGWLTLGVTDEKGKDLWNIAVPPGNKRVSLPSAPVLPFEPNRRYSLFFFVSGKATEFTLRDVRVRKPIRTELIPRARRYGAIMR